MSAHLRSLEHRRHLQTMSDGPGFGGTLLYFAIVLAFIYGLWACCRPWYVMSDGVVSGSEVFARVTIAWSHCSGFCSSFEQHSIVAGELLSRRSPPHSTSNHRPRSTGSRWCTPPRPATACIEFQPTRRTSLCHQYQRAAGISRASLARTPTQSCFAASIVVVQTSRCRPNGRSGGSLRHLSGGLLCRILRIDLTHFAQWEWRWQGAVPLLQFAVPARVPPRLHPRLARARRNLSLLPATLPRVLRRR